MNSFTLRNELLASGWDRVCEQPKRSLKIATIAARYYTGVETKSDLQNRVETKDLTSEEVNLIIRWR